MTFDHIKIKIKKTPEIKILKIKIANVAVFKTSIFFIQSHAHFVAFNAQAFIGQKKGKAHIIAIAAKIKFIQFIGIIDSKCFHTMISSKNNFIEDSSLIKHVSIEIINDYHMKIIGIEKMFIENELFDETIVESNVSDVLHMPKLFIGLLSMRMFIKRSVKVIFEDDVCFIQNTDRRQMMHVIEHGGQYEIQQFRFQVLITNFAIKFNEKTLQLGHCRIDHFNNDDSKRLIIMISGINLTHAIKHKHLCDSYMKEKHIKKSFRRPQ